MNNQNLRPKLGISACLMGASVRFDGSHKRSNFCQNTLAQYVDWTAICPEVEIGMAVPRPAIRLVDVGENGAQDIRAVGTKEVDPRNAALDVTQPLYEYGREKGRALKDLDGYVFMQKSPSCGVFSTKKYLLNGHSDGVISGLYAQGFLEENPLLPVEEAGRLNDVNIRDNFLIRIYAYSDWRQNVIANLTKTGLIQYHARHKYLLMAHSNHAYQELGRLLSNLKAAPLTEIAQQYIAGFMQAMSKPASRKRNTNALMHVAGYLKRVVDQADRTTVAALIEQYRIGQVPIVVPLTMMQHFMRKHLPHESYIQQQAYLSPYPEALGVRNHI